MNEISLGILMIVTGGLIVRGLIARTGMLRYSFLAPLVVAGWFIPQAIGLMEDYLLPPFGFPLTMLYASACLLAIYFGERGVRLRIVHGEAVYSESRLLVGASVLSAIGLAAYSQTFRVEWSFTEDGLTTGLVTILYFFSRLQYFGLAIALLVLLRRWSWWALAIVALDLNSILGFIVFGGRRGPAVDVILIVLCVLWFQRRILVPRVLPLGGAVIGAIVVNGVGSYRALVTEKGGLPTWEEFMSLDLVEQFSQTITEGSYEVRNAIAYVIATFESSNYDFGAQYWNSMIFSYVPAQFLGADLKAALMFDLRDNAVDMYGYARHIGTTFTGFADSFISFSFLGVLVYFGISRLLARWWCQANGGDMRAQALYALSMATALLGVSHATQWFVAFLPQLFIFVLPLFAWAKVKGIQSRAIATNDARQAPLMPASSPSRMAPRFKP